MNAYCMGDEPQSFYEVFADYFFQKSWVLIWVNRKLDRLTWNIKYTEAQYLSRNIFRENNHTITLYLGIVFYFPPEHGYV